MIRISHTFLMIFYYYLPYSLSFIKEYMIYFNFKFIKSFIKINLLHKHVLFLLCFSYKYRNIFTTYIIYLLLTSLFNISLSISFLIYIYKLLIIISILMSSINKSFIDFCKSKYPLYSFNTFVET